MGMARSSAWRRLGLFVGGSIAAAPLLLQPLPAAAATTGTLFALLNSPLSIATVDPASGALTQLADLSLPDGLGGGYNPTMADDPTNHRLFLDRTLVDLSVDPIAITHQLVTIDSVSGAVSASPLDHDLSGLVFDPSTGTLFGFTAECCPAQIVTVDPGTGAETHVADLTGESFSLMALAPTTHSIYLDSESFASNPPTDTILTVNTATGVVSQSPDLTTGTRSLAYDSSNASLFGITFGQPQFVHIDPSTGSETAVGAYDFGTLFVGPGAAVDPATHTIFMVQSDFDPAIGLVSHIASINDQTGAGVLGASTGTGIATIAFEPANAAPNLKADLQAAIASGAIDNAGVAGALLAELNAATAAQSRGQCSAAIRLYQAFINDLMAQSGKHVAAATATQLAGEAQFQMTQCS
jgi:hypothetical protein